MKKIGKQLLVVVLMVALLTMSVVIGKTALLAETTEPELTIIVGSDFQNKSGNSAGKKQVSYILEAMAEDGITKADAFFSCGDYDYDTERSDLSATNSGIEALQSVMSTVVDEENMIIVQGNHDVPFQTIISGNNDPQSGAYGVYVINQDDYMMNNREETTIKCTAQRLTDYLNEKIAAGYDKPIFVLSHLPLHYSMRTHNDGDGRHANYLFDALNKAGEQGLNIFFLYGHDHSNGWDDYLGGSAVFLKKGDPILIAQNSKTEFKEETLAFTYLNAGYMGYYNNENGADDTLTMTAISIANNQVTFTRYSKDGVHDLKSAGVRNSYKEEDAYEPNETVYTSPQTVNLTAVSNQEALPTVMNLPKIGRQYTRIKSADQLVDGGQYLIIYDGAPNYYVLPQVVTNADTEGVKRTGFNLLATYGFGAEYAYGDYADREWTFTKTEAGWLLTYNGAQVKLTQTEETAITATLEETGDPFTIVGDNYRFIFQSGDYVFNYNARQLMNAFTDYPSTFYIYQFTGVVEEDTEDVGNMQIPWVPIIIVIAVVVIACGAGIVILQRRKKK